MLVKKIIPTVLLVINLSACQKAEHIIDLKKFEYERIIKAADEYIDELPVTVTAFRCERSMGGRNDFYSEGDYWWPNPENPDGPYIRKDGKSNPDNFVAHRTTMQNLNIWVPTLVAAYELTGDSIYAQKAMEHINAWFVNTETRMNPNLLYGQAIKGRVSGRGIGIIDTIHLIEVAKAIDKLHKSGYLCSTEFKDISVWFSEYTHWLTTHPYGIDERDHGNNHSAWWVAQVAVFSDLIGNTEDLEFCRNHYKEAILPQQVDTLGRFIDEIKRTKPYSYSLFNLDAFALICHVLTNENDNLWEYKTHDGKSVEMAFEFMYPHIKDKSNWPFPPDIAHFDELPVRTSGLLFGGIAYNKREYIELWQKLEANFSEKELVRTFAIRQPLLWVE